MSLQDQSLYEFGPFRLKPAERLLLRGGEAVALPPKAFETLVLLVQNSGHALSRDELIQSLWPNSFVEENNLTQHISILRRTLGETSDGQSYIETVPRLGYRFIAPVSEVCSSGRAQSLLRRHTRARVAFHEEEQIIEEETTSARVTEEAKPARRAWPLPATPKGIVATAGILAALLVGGYFGVFWTQKLWVRTSYPRALAVLPFRDLKPSPESQFLGYSLADAIISRLAGVSEIAVRPSSYISKYRDGDADPRVVARELHVQAILTGSYIREGNRVRVSAELVDVPKADVLWHETLDLPYEQMMTVQDHVAENVVRGLALRILPQEAERLKQTVPKNPLAYEYFLRGSAVGNTYDDYRLAAQLLEKSVTFDPSFALAWARLGAAYYGLGTWQGGGSDYLAKSKTAFDQALALDPKVPYVRTSLAISMMERGELENGLQSLREELRLYPNEAFAHWWLTEAYLYGGMLGESIAEGELALRLDPLVNEGSTFNSYLHAGNYDKFLSTMPAGEGARNKFYRGLCFFYQHNYSHAAEDFERAYQVDPSLLHARYGRVLLYAIREQPAEGLQYLEQIEQESPTGDGEMLYKMAQMYAVLGDKGSALRLLRETIDHNFYCHACFVRDPLLEPIRNEPDYAQLMNLASTRHEAFRRKFF